MKLEYSLNENDFLQHQLYIASKSDRIKTQRKKSIGAVLLLLVIIGFVFYQANNLFMVYSVLVAVVLALIFHPGSERRRYHKHYRRYIADTFKNRFDVNSTVSITDASIDMSDPGAESKIYLSELDEIVETGSHIFLRLKGGGSIIVPKLRIENKEQLYSELMELAQKLKINYNRELEWKWK